jgi:hypothetical protein
MADETEVVVQPSVDEVYTEMKENGPWPAEQKWPETLGTDVWTEAYSRYQADHEAPQEEREELTAKAVEINNTIAQEEGAELADEA